MRKALILGLVWLAVTGVAIAQNGSMTGSMTGPTDEGRDPQGQARLNRSQAPDQQRPQQGRGHDQPPPLTPTTTPVARCADLAVTTLGFVSSVPGEPPLAAGEAALQYDVHNAGTSMYVAPGGASQSLTLEYSTPGGVHQLATMALPPPASATTQVAAQGVTLGQGQSWRGYIRMAFPEAARRWPLKLRINFAQSSSPYAMRISDCDPDNNEVVIPRSQLPPLPGQPAQPAG